MHKQTVDTVLFLIYTVTDRAVNNVIITVKIFIVNIRKEIVLKKSEKTQKTKEKIINAAICEFGENGYHNASLNRICRDYSISKGLIYYNFENKDKLYTCCVKKAVGDFISYMSEIDYKDNFNRYMQKRYAFFEENPYYSRLVFESVSSNDAEFIGAVEEQRSKFFDFNYNIFVKAIDGVTLKKGVSREDALEYYTLLQNMLNSYTSVQIFSGKSFSDAWLSREKTLGRILNYMLYGIAEENK